MRVCEGIVWKSILTAHLTGLVAMALAWGVDMGSTSAARADYPYSVFWFLCAVEFVVAWPVALALYVSHGGRDVSERVLLSVLSAVVCMAMQLVPPYTHSFSTDWWAQRLEWPAAAFPLAVSAAFGVATWALWDEVFHGEIAPAANEGDKKKD